MNSERSNQTNTGCSNRPSGTSGKNTKPDVIHALIVSCGQQLSYMHIRIYNRYPLPACTCSLPLPADLVSEFYNNLSLVISLVS